MFFNPFSSIINFDDYDEILEQDNEPKDITCPKCSQRLSDLNETLFVGCPNCYKVFAPYIKDLALRYHGRCAHVGKVIDVNRNKDRLEKEIAELSRQEKQAVLERDYLKAEEIKRKIKSLRGQSDGSC